MQGIAALVAVRLNSERCRLKMTRTFASTSLVDLAIDRLSKINNVKSRYYAAYEKEFINRRLPANITLIRRSEQSANIDGPISKIHDYLQGVEEEYILWINACNAFLSPKTLEKAVETFNKKKCQSMTSVIKNYNWFYTLDGRPINNTDPTCISTKSSPPLYEVVHAFHIFRREFLLKNDAYWSHGKKDPYLFEITQEEAIDIDTETDFKVAEKLYIEKNEKNILL